MLVPYEIRNIIFKNRKRMMLVTKLEEKLKFPTMQKTTRTRNGQEFVATINCDKMILQWFIFYPSRGAWVAFISLNKIGSHQKDLGTNETVRSGHVITWNPDKNETVIRSSSVREQIKYQVFPDIKYYYMEMYELKIQIIRAVLKRFINLHVNKVKGTTPVHDEPNLQILL
jgi:uncharacterized protein (DUF608 family)